MIDRVTVKGSNVPLDLYTVDIYDYPARFGCDCGDPAHVVDAEFESDPFVEHTQHAAPEGECDSEFIWFTQGHCYTVGAAANAFSWFIHVYKCVIKIENSTGL